jgi:hypothetical protein
MTIYLHNLAVSLSQLANTLLGGHPDMTISAAAWVRSQTAQGDRVRAAMDALFWWDADHCRESFLRDVQFASRVLNIQRRILRGSRG